MKSICSLLPLLFSPQILRISNGFIPNRSLIVRNCRRDVAARSVIGHGSDQIPVFQPFNFDEINVSDILKAEEFYHTLDENDIDYDGTEMENIIKIFEEKVSHVNDCRYIQIMQWMQLMH